MNPVEYYALSSTMLIESMNSNTYLCTTIFTATKRCPCKKAVRTSGQSYKHFTSVNYNPRVVIWAIFKSYDSRVVNYDRKMLYKIDHREYSLSLSLYN